MNITRIFVTKIPPYYLVKKVTCKKSMKNKQELSIRTQILK